MRWIIRIALGLVLLLMLLFGGLALSLYMGPSNFNKMMARIPTSQTPGPLFAPLLPMMNLLRAGRLHVGELAPDFDLNTVDKKARVRLASFRGDRPVVLVFGSYT